MTDIRQAIEFTAPIQELTGDPSQIVILDAVMVAEMTDGDDSPQFPIVSIKEGTSKNKLKYGANILESVAEQINATQPVGYLGHVHREAAHKDNLLPAPQTVWAGASTSVDADGKKVLYVKGYNLPKSDVRDWIKRKAVNSVSWAGDAVLTPLKGGGYEVKEFFLESIDWSRKNSQGMEAKLVAVVSEMETITERVKMTPEEISSLQLAELEAHNESLVNLIKTHASREARESTIAEMEAARSAEDPATEVVEIGKLRELLGVDNGKDIVEAVGDIYNKIEDAAKAEVQAWFNELLAEKIPNEKSRGLVGRLVGVKEMAGDFVNDKAGIKAELESRLNDALENDEDVKTAVAEMGATKGGLNLGHVGSTDAPSGNLTEEEVSL